MGKKIVWRKKAVERFHQVYLYLEKEWSEKTANEFVELVDEKIRVLQQFPKIGIKSAKKKELRKLLLSRQNMLIYRIEKDKIILLNIYDTRQNPIRIDF